MPIESFRGWKGFISKALEHGIQCPANAFQRFRQMGAFVTTSEAVLLQLVGDKDHPQFKQIQQLIKVSAPTSGL